MRGYKPCLYFILISIFFLLLQNPVFAGVPPVWADILPGPHGIGFMTVEKYDYSRSFRAKHDYFGAVLEGERARPLQICLWYPALTADEAATMVYGEYAFPYPADERFMEILSNLHNRELGTLFQQFNRDQALVQELMSVKMAAVRDAPAAEGVFPLIIYHSGPGCMENVVLYEYLASHGFVVATTHALGMATLNPDVSQNSLEAMIRDKEFILTETPHLPFIDRNKLGLMGFSYGSIAAVIMAMRNSEVDAVVGLQSEFLRSENFHLLTDNAFYNPSRLHIPLMQLYAEDNPPKDLSFIDSFVYAGIYNVKLTGLRYFDFTHYGLMYALTDPAGTGVTEGIKNGYHTICRYVRYFFDARLNKNQAGYKFLSGTPEEAGFDSTFVAITYRKGEDLPPSPDQFQHIVTEYGAAKGAEIFDRFRKLNPGLILLQEAPFNALGYRLLQAGQSDDAVKIFRMIAETYPNSANAWDSYGEGCAAAGDIKTATACYKKVLEVLPGDNNIDDRMKSLLKTNADNFLGTPGTTIDR